MRGKGLPELVQSLMRHGLYIRCRKKNGRLKVKAAERRADLRRLPLVPVDSPSQIPILFREEREEEID